MIDVTKEQLRRLQEASGMIPGCPHISTLIRWFQQGIKGVKLETVLVGGRRFTSLEAIHRFIERRNSDQDEQDNGNEWANARRRKL
jgi:hypothetical protein